MSREKRIDIAVFLLRVVAGFLFMEYGGMKLFGWFGNTALGFGGLMGLAGILEFFGGIAILIGLWVRPIVSS
jgi:putative oxidoreductase